MLPAWLLEARYVVKRKHPFQHSGPPHILQMPLQINMQAYLEMCMCATPKFFCTLMGALFSLRLFY